MVLFRRQTCGLDLLVSVIFRPCKGEIFLSCVKTFLCLCKGNTTICMKKAHLSSLAMLLPQWYDLCSNQVLFHTWTSRAPVFLLKALSITPSTTHSFPPTPHVASLCVIGMGLFLREAGFEYKFHSLLLCFPPTENSGPFCCPLGRNATHVSMPPHPPKDPQTCVFQLNKNNFSPANRWVWKVPNVRPELDWTRLGWQDVSPWMQQKKTNKWWRTIRRQGSFPHLNKCSRWFWPRW